MLNVYLCRISATQQNEYLPIPDTDLEYTISNETNFYLIRDFSRYKKDIEEGKEIKSLKIRPKGKISPEYSFVGDFAGNTVAITYNKEIPNNISEVYAIDKCYIDNANPVSLAMLKLGYPEFSRIEDPNISQIKLELTGRDALKIKDIIIPDSEGNIVIACKYGRSWFYNYKNELPWYCNFDKAKLEDALSVAANVNKLKLFTPEE